jgi:hypothetical protein
MVRQYQLPTLVRQYICVPRFDYHYALHIGYYWIGSVHGLVSGSSWATFLHHLSNMPSSIISWAVNEHKSKAVWWMSSLHMPKSITLGFVLQLRPTCAFLLDQTRVNWHIWRPKALNASYFSINTMLHMFQLYSYFNSCTSFFLKKIVVVLN